MKTELSFLLELLLDHKLSKPTQKAIKDRIDEVQVAPQAPVPINQVQPSTFRTTPVPPRDPAAQPESTRKLLEKHGMAHVAAQSEPVAPAEEAKQGIPAANGVTAAALAARQQMILEGIAGPKKGSVASPKAHGTPRG